MPPAKSAIWNRAEEIVHLLKEGWTLDRLAKHLRTIIGFISSLSRTPAEYAQSGNKYARAPMLRREKAVN